MNWIKAILAGVVGGIALSIFDFIVHGFIMADTYMRFPVFTQEQANPLWFLVLPILIGIFAAIIFAKTRSAWAPGPKGGLVFGFWLGMFSFFPQFYNGLVIEGFPYYLSWCWGGISLLGAMVWGVVAGAIYKSA